MTDDPEQLADAIRKTRQGSAGWLIQRLSGQLDLAVDRELAPLGLTVQSFAIVMTLLEEDGLTQTQIGGRFKAPAYAITRAIDALETDGFLERRPHPTSRRTNTVHATNKARELAPALMETVARVNERLRSGLGEAEAKQAHALMRTMLDNNDLLKD